MGKEELSPEQLASLWPLLRTVSIGILWLAGKTGWEILKLLGKTIVLLLKKPQYLIGIAAFTLITATAIGLVADNSEYEYEYDYEPYTPDDSSFFAAPDSTPTPETLIEIPQIQPSSEQSFPEQPEIIQIQPPTPQPKEIIQIQPPPEQQPQNQLLNYCVTANLKKYPADNIEKSRPTKDGGFVRYKCPEETNVTNSMVSENCDEQNARAWLSLDEENVYFCFDKRGLKYKKFIPQE